MNSNTPISFRRWQNRTLTHAGNHSPGAAFSFILRNSQCEQVLPMGNGADFLNNQHLLEGLTIRARAAYYFAVAESVFAAAPPDDGSLEIARQAMNMAWQWIEGASIEADELDWYLENEDTGLQYFIKSNTFRGSVRGAVICDLAGLPGRSGTLGADETHGADDL